MTVASKISNVFGEKICKTGLGPPPGLIVLHRPGDGGSMARVVRLALAEKTDCMTASRSVQCDLPMRNVS
jgi:hypothetical protein